MYIVSVPNRSSPPATLLRESYREEGKVKNRTLANLSSWAPERVEVLRQVLKGGIPTTGPQLEAAFDIVASRPHGHVAAVLGTMQKLRLAALLDGQRSRARDLCVAMIAARVLRPGSKLATARALDSETRDSTLGEMVDVHSANEDELYRAMDWLLDQQESIENALAKRHLSDGALVLYDVTSTYFEGRGCSLAKLGHSRDDKSDRPQIVIGLLTDREGCPVAAEVFDGNVGDPKTVRPQIEKLRGRFGLKRIVLVGDRGMITEARIREDLATDAGCDWITALRAPAIQQLVEDGALQLSLFDERDMGAIHDPSHPDERFVVCKNPILAVERARKRQEMLAATERALAKVAAATTRKRNRLKGRDVIALRVGKVLGRSKMSKHFKLKIGDASFSFERDEDGISRETALDGFYVIRTSVPATELSDAEVVLSYKRLANVERAFRSIKTVDLHIRPIHHRKAERVRAHVLLCMLAYYVEWHMRRALAPILFDDHDKQSAARARISPVAPAQRSERAKNKISTRRTEDNLPVHSFQTLLRDLATVTKNRIEPKARGTQPFDVIARPNAVQARALKLLGASLV